MEAAAKWRRTFFSDVVVDVCGYRRNGHNEQDNPSITQPHIQRCIDRQPSIIDLYSARLRREHVVSQADIDGWEQKLLADYESGTYSVVLC
jgi:2-oxoglutarate dehydrogenase E1 component